MSATVSPLLQVDGLCVRYGKIAAVGDVSLSVDAGEFVSLIGNNGAGKSSTLKAIAGVVKPAAGRVLVSGRPADGLQPHEIVRMGISLVPEGRGVFADQTVMDNLMLGAYTRTRRHPREVESDLERAFELFPVLKARLAQLAGSLSGGEQQMLAIARGLLARPKLLMIDEMSLGLAPKVLDALVPVLTRLNRDGLAVLLVEQLASLALRITHRCYIFESSRVVLHGPSSELLRSEQVTEAYMGRLAAGRSGGTRPRPA
jgi:branched-chain amino acid transport system ATP-binding protein